MSAAHGVSRTDAEPDFSRFVLLFATVRDRLRLSLVAGKTFPLLGCLHWSSSARSSRCIGGCPRNLRKTVGCRLLWWGWWSWQSGRNCVH